MQIRIFLLNCLQEELDQPDLRPQGEIEEELVRRDREAPLGKGCFAPGTFRGGDVSYTPLWPTYFLFIVPSLPILAWVATSTSKT